MSGSSWSPGTTWRTGPRTCPRNPILGTLKERTEREPKDHLAPTSRGWGGLLCLRALHYDCTVEFIRESEPHGSEWDEL